MCKLTQIANSIIVCGKIKLIFPLARLYASFVSCFSGQPLTINHINTKIAQTFGTISRSAPALETLSRLL